MVTFLVGIRRHVARHMGRGWQKGAVLTHKVRTGERVNLQAALNTLVEGMGRQPCLFGLETSDYQHSRLGANLISRISFNPWPLPIVWDSLPCASGRDMSVADDALYLVRGSDGPFCAYVMKQSKDQRKQAILVILARSLAAARNSLDELLRLAERQSHYRGNVISVKHHDPTEDDFTVEFHTLAPVDRDAIVLPENVLRVAERNTIGFIRNAAALRQAGRDTRHGVLLYGPPGTGKTLVTRYLASQSSPCTVILLSGRQYAYLRTACQLARALAPSLVVLEDVDLIAADRRKNRHAPLLHELMDEMDGLGSGADCTFLLTTNRPDALEPALAARPGRVDQAVYFPLPDLECRRRLLRQFGNGLDLNGVEQEPFLQRTEGASPAFLKELVRRSALMAVERGERSSPLRLTNEDFVQALRELVEFGGKLTRNFLGFPASEPPQPR
jgi:AAA+ superfamily predicted ATPase